MPLGVARWDFFVCMLKPCQLVLVLFLVVPCAATGQIFHPHPPAGPFYYSLEEGFLQGFNPSWRSVIFVEEHGVSQPQGCTCSCCWVIHKGKSCLLEKTNQPTPVFELGKHMPHMCKWLPRTRQYVARQGEAKWPQLGEI